MTDPGLFDELLDYVGFGDEDARTLERVGPHVAPTFDGIIDEFYAAIEARPRALAVFTGGEPQIARQKTRLNEWLRQLFCGVYDDAYFRARARIGRVHVRVELPQHFMFTSMSIIRNGLHVGLDASSATEPLRRAGHVAIDRICDIELAVMLETYRERFVEQQRARERLATLGQLAASVGHELRNPLAVISTSVHLLRRHVDEPKAVRHVEKVERQVAVASRIVTDLLSMVRNREPQREDTGLLTLVDEVLDGLPDQRGSQLTITIPADLPTLHVDRLQLRQVIANLLFNALQALEGRSDGLIQLRASAADGTLVLVVLDDGPGFDADVIDRVFDPLVTTRETGVGLGLALCQRIIQGHNGEVFAENREEGGARVGFRIPKAFAEGRQ